MPAFTDLSTQNPRVLAQNLDAVRAHMLRRGAEAEFDTFVGLDRTRRELLGEVEALRAQANRLRPNGKPTDEQKRALADLATRRKAAEAGLTEYEEKTSRARLALPNVLADDVPDTEAQVIRTVGQAGRTGREHTELAGGWLDAEAGARLSGSRFTYLKGPIVRLQVALTAYVLDILEAHGFMPVIPPVLVHERALLGTGFLPDAEGQIYATTENDLFLTGTSEVALASLHADQLIDADGLPLRYAGLSTCFRREAGAAGKDTHGILRQHQFDKIEMFAFVTPEESVAEQARILAVEEEILTGLKIPYRVVNIPVWDLGNPAAKKYDCEAWLPGQAAYRELTSCSNTTDYQAARLNIRVRGKDGNRNLHTLNGTACAMGRTIIALLENGQDEDGVVHLPDTLVRYGAPATITRP